MLETLVFKIMRDGVKSIPINFGHNHAIHRLFKLLLLLLLLLLFHHVFQTGSSVRLLWDGH